MMRSPRPWFSTVALYVSLLTLLCLTGVVARAATLNVPADHDTIQDAINAANTGDHVVIAPGTYPENINFNGKAITVRSTDPTNAAVVAATVIDGQELGSVVTFASGEGTNSVLSGLTITHGKADYGGGIHCVNSSPTISNNTISENSATQGGAIYCPAYNSSSTISNNTISGNSATGSGGGIFGGDTITDNTITGNSAFNGGGICAGNSISNNAISGNSASGGGGGILGGDIITGNTITENSADICGGGIFGGNTITNNTITGNSGGAGGGIGCSDCSSPTISNNTISGNAAGDNGGGIYGDATSNPTVTYCDVYGNTGGNYEGIPDPTGTNGNISQDPLFADAAGGDWHLKSMVGRWDRTTETWVTDAVHSPCIDAGDPSSDYSNEPDPNGARINMGAYGNTTEASKGSSVPPAKPTDLTASVNASNFVELNWTDSSSNEDGFKLRRRKQNADGSWPDWSNLTRLPGNSESYTDDTITEDGRYQYGVRAFNNTGPSAYARVAVWRVRTTPAAPTDFAAAVNESGEVELSWTDNADNEDGFKLRRRKQNVDGSWPDWTNLTRLPGNSESHTDDTITEDGRYQYGVRAFNKAGPSAYARVAVWRVMTTPAAPTDLVAVVNESGEVELSWTDNANNEDGFKLRRRKRTADCSWPAWSNLTRLPGNSESYTDDTITEDGRYQYSVRAFNKAGPSAYVRVGVQRTTGAGMPAAICSVAVTQANGQFVNIVYGLSAAADITVEVRNIAGRLVRAIPCGTAAAGLNTATWNLRNGAGAPVPSGMYLCTITARADDGTQATAVRTVTVRR